MIPRRRIEIAWRDLVDILRAPFQSPAADRAAVEAFERAFAQHLGCRFARATASGRDALELILDGLALGAGDELVIPAYTLGELVPLMQARGVRLVAADVDPTTLNVTARTIAARLTPRTRAVLVAHLFGAPCDVRGIARLAGERGLALIEDCAHALGARVGGRAVGTFGAAALFSLEVNKPVATFGGGMLVARDARIAEHAARRLAARRRTPWPALRKALLKCAEELAVRSPLYGPVARRMFSEGRAGGFERFYRGMHDRVRAERVAYAGFQARIGLRRLQELERRQQRLNRRWAALAGQLPPRFSLQRRDRHGQPAFYSFVGLHAQPPSALRARALALGVDLAIGSEVMDDVACLLGQDDCPGARQAHERAVLVPLHEGVRGAALDRIARVLREASAEVAG